MIFSLFLQKQLTNIICLWVLYFAIVFKTSAFLKLEDKLDIFLDHTLVEEKNIFSSLWFSHAQEPCTFVSWLFLDMHLVWLSYSIKHQAQNFYYT